MTSAQAGIRIRHLGLVDYDVTYARMRAFTESRSKDTADELWFLEHPPVFTQGQAGKSEHLLNPGTIPVVASNRGGQVTYHGPGQLVVYPLIDLQRLGIGIRDLVSCLERAMIATLAGYGIRAHARADAPGVYVDVRSQQCKIGSLGLRVSRGCSYHGLSLNVDMDLEPFERINPCGYAGLHMTQIAELVEPRSVSAVAADLETQLRHALYGGSPS